MRPIDTQSLARAQNIVDIECAKREARAERMDAPVIESMMTTDRIRQLLTDVETVNQALKTLEWAKDRYSGPDPEAFASITTSRQFLVQDLAALAADCQRWIAAELVRSPEAFK